VAADLERNLARLEADLRQLEAEYNMFFGGRLATPPWETRTRVEATVRTLDRTHIQNTGLRFRFLTLQSRFATFIELWDRGQRAREEGRSGPFAQARKSGDAARASDARVLHVAAFHDPAHEKRKLEDLYQSLAAARREVGAPQVSFEKFAALVESQVSRMRAGGSGDVAFRVAVKDGKVALTARAVATPAAGRRGERGEER
jgi:hypothetical protein